MKISSIKLNPYQPTKTFHHHKLQHLPHSITTHPILQPILLRKTINPYYILLPQPPFRPSKLAPLHQLPPILKCLSHSHIMKLPIIQNLQTQHLNPIQQPQTYQPLINHLPLTQQKLPQTLPKSPPYIPNILTLLNLPSHIPNLLTDNP
ncbi:ParB/RepB/Spo0J family partition protein, partial [Staphylococcus hominis]|uniref:ParB/RepB/Spo0J family partition protein n=1 Tax=Staphylococcus hominis TaxID=1290 RepID=UPI0028D3E3E2